MINDLRKIYQMVGNVFGRKLKEAADYFGLPSTIDIPDRVIIVAPYSRAIIFRDYFDTFDKGKRDAGVCICRGSYRGEPVAVMACGKTNKCAAESMKKAAQLGFQKAIFLGSSYAIDKRLELGDFVISTEACQSRLSDITYDERKLRKCMDKIKKVRPDRKILHAIEGSLKITEIEFTKGKTYSTDATPDIQRIMLPELWKRDYLVIDSEHAAILRNAGRDGTDAAALLHVKGLLESRYSSGWGFLSGDRTLSGNYTAIGDEMTLRELGFSSNEEIREIDQVDPDDPNDMSETDIPRVAYIAVLNALTSELSDK